MEKYNLIVLKYGIINQLATNETNAVIQIRKEKNYQGINSIRN